MKKIISGIILLMICMFWASGGLAQEYTPSPVTAVERAVLDSANIDLHLRIAGYLIVGEYISVDSLDARIGTFDSTIVIKIEATDKVLADSIGSYSDLQITMLDDVVFDSTVVVKGKTYLGDAVGDSVFFRTTVIDLVTDARTKFGISLTDSVQFIGPVFFDINVDVVDNLTAGDIIIDEAAGVLDFTGATSATISASGCGKVTIAAGDTLEVLGNVIELPSGVTKFGTGATDTVSFAGKVGIGTTAPNKLLTIQGVSYPALCVGTDNTHQFSMEWDHSVSIGKVQTTGHGFPLSFGNGSLYIGAGSGIGKIGIGTTTPYAVNEITNEVPTWALYDKDVETPTSFATIDTSAITMFAASGSEAIKMYDSDGVMRVSLETENGIYVTDATGADSLSISNDGTYTNIYSDNPLRFNNDLLFDAATHNIGDLTNHVDTLFVSTIQPASVLAIVGSTSVTGNLAATTHGGITQANLLDKTATEAVTGAWSFADTVSVKEVSELIAHIDLITLANINDTYVYDTTRDDDGGAWTCDARAQASSWYNETLNTATRGATKAFPKKAVLVATNSYLYVIDAKDNSMWMRFNQGVANLFPNANSTSICALNGKIYVTFSNSNVYEYDFKTEISFTWYSNATYSGYYKSNIVDRNAGSNWLLGFSNRGFVVSSTCNDVSAAVIAGKTYVAVATDGGATGNTSLINETDEIVYDLGTATDDANSVWLTSDGTLYILNETKGQLEVFYNVQDIVADDTSPDVTYDESSIPALWPTTPTVNVAPCALAVQEGASMVDGKSNKIFVGFNEGAIQLNEKQGDETNGSVKPYTKDFIGENQIGDVRAAWHFTDNAATATVDDASVKGNDLTASRNTENLSSSGIRGTGFTFASGSSDYLTRAYDADFNFGTGSFSISFGLKHPDTAGGQVKIIDRTDGSTIGFQVYIDTAGKLIFRISDDGTNWDTITSTNAVDNDAWHYGVVKKNGTTNIQMRLDGVDGATAVAIANATTSISGTTPTLDIGRDNGDSEYYNGELDELTITAELVTASQDLHMYRVAKRALENHTADRVDSIAADDYQKLQGTSNICKAVAVDEEAGMVFIGTNDGSDGGAVTQLGIDTDSVHDQWINGAGIVDDDGTAWNSDDIVAISVASVQRVNGTGHGVLAIGTDQEHWIENPTIDVKAALQQAIAPEISKRKVTTKKLITDEILFSSDEVGDVGSPNAKANRVYADTVHANHYGGNSDFTIGSSGEKVTFTGDTTKVGLIVQASANRIWRSRYIPVTVPRLPTGAPAALGNYQEFPTLDFAAGADDNAYHLWHIPAQYAAGDSIRSHFRVMLPGAVTSDSLVAFAVEYKRLADGDTFDFSTGTSTVLDSLNFNGYSAYEIQDMTLNLTTTGWVEEDQVLMRLYRDVDGVGTNYNDDARIIAIHMDYKSAGIKPE